MPVLVWPAFVWVPCAYERGGRVGLAATLLVLLGCLVGLRRRAWTSTRSPARFVATRCTSSGAERALTDDEIDELRSVIRSADTPIYIAVLPARRPTSPVATRRRWPASWPTPLIDPARSVLSSATVTTPGVASWLLAKLASWRRRCFDANGDNAAAVLNDFVERVGDAARVQPAGRASPMTAVTTVAVAAAGCSRWC